VANDNRFALDPPVDELAGSERAGGR